MIEAFAIVRAILASSDTCLNLAIQQIHGVNVLETEGATVVRTA